MDTLESIGSRIRAVMPASTTQRALADRVGMAPDALSRALNGQRGLSPMELTRIAEELRVQTHWLITGDPDPFTVTVAARHAWDATRRVRSNAGREDDAPLLDQIVEVYRAAHPDGAPASASLPHDALEMRRRLGAGFVGRFADIVERELGVDVIRIPHLSTDYSLTVGERAVVVLAAMPSWFRSNWSLAHELGHLALGHHVDRGGGRQDRKSDQHEPLANRFAADLLLPRDTLLDVAELTSEAELARTLWDLGVSTHALRTRLDDTGVTPTTAVAEGLAKTTPRLLRDHASVLPLPPFSHDPIATREQVASGRRFPTDLVAALQHQVEAGSASPTLLAWTLDVSVDDLDFPEPDDTPSAEFEAMISGQPHESTRIRAHGSAG